MANQSIRIRTTPGNSSNIRVKLEQDFDFLEVLSLKISQEDLYQTFCSNYGVVVGRVIANKGFGVPNAKISVFIPITDEDQKNTLIKDLYPFKTPYQKNNGVRYNLLLSKTTCYLNNPVGTFPSKEEMLDNDTVLEVFDKYYKYTTKTNSAGDFMIFGAPVGQYTIHMDIDLSDAGAASLRPYDLIADGFPAKLFNSNTEFKTATNLDSLPQIKTGNIGVDIIPFWGDTDTCEIGITRVDFDTNVDIKTSAIFFGSIFTDSGKMSMNKGCNPKNKQGRQENLKTGPGTIEMIRVTDIDANEWYNNNKIKPLGLEKFSVGDSELIDNDGVFTYALPLNIGHIITDEFGNYVASPDPSIGVPTKGMYRFKMKFSQGKTGIFNKIKAKFRTATLFFPSLGVDFGGTKGVVDTGSQLDSNGTQDQRWTTDITQYNSGLNDPNSPIESPTFTGLPVYASSRIGLDFHLFEWKQVYTIAHFIKKYKKGGNRFSFLGIKQTDEGPLNPFPFTNAIWSFDIIYYLGAAIIDLRKFFIKMIIQMIGFCIKICFYLAIDIPGISIPKIVIFSGNDFIPEIAFPGFSTPGIHIELANFCYQICPLSFIGNFGSFTLECENAPNGEYYEIPPKDQYGNDLGWYACNPTGCGTSFGCNCTPSTATNNPLCNFNIANKPAFKFGFGSSSVAAGSTCLDILTDWECCSKLRLAEERNVIQRVFNDAWVFGTAYLFQFKYKRKVKKSTGELRKEKFCGPGSDHARGDNYKSNKCCPDTKDIDNNCTKCLLRGPGFSSTTGYYHTLNHNYSVNLSQNGAVDIEDLIYCNALMSTKIVSVGSQEICQETLEEITNASLASQALVQYEQNSNFYTGTFYENGWDPNFWVNILDETSYEDPIDVLTYMGKVFPDNSCQLRDMFWGGSIANGYPCHEYELKDYPYFFMKEVSKIYIDIETGSGVVVNNIITNEDEFNPQGTTNNSGLPPSVYNPYGDLVNDPPLWGGFLVDKEVASRFSPCGGQGNCVGKPANNWVGGIPGQQTVGGQLAINAEDADNNSWDRYIQRGDRNNANSRSNIPYYYFGINPGKTAINKLRTEFFTRVDQ